MDRRLAGRRARIPYLICLGVMFCVGWLWRGQPAIPADARRAPPPVHFESGGARSLAVLQQIASSLQQIEERLERMERMAQRWSPPASRPEGERLGGAFRGEAATNVGPRIVDGDSAR